MTASRLAILFLLGCGLSTAAFCAPDDPVPTANTAGAPAAVREAQIPFSDKTIWNWRVVDDHTVLIQDRGRKWYKATLIGTCFNLPFSEKLGFEANAGGTFDKFSSIRVRGQRCPLISLVEATAPPKKSKAKGPDTAPAAK
jgi:Family of unknown function (DUF6491)